MLKVIDLFAGAGGLSFGFQLTGKFKLLAAAEINKNARATYKDNIAKNNDDFIFIDNVVNYDFAKLNEKLGGIDIVIGGPPCQGFSNANRQKNHLISTNNNLIKEFFRAIKEIKPKAFVMENVSMLRSETHRFYESTKDQQEIDYLINNGFEIPKRKDSLFIAKNEFEGIDLITVEQLDFASLSLPIKLYKLINVLYKNISNPRRLPTYLKKHTKEIVTAISNYIERNNDNISDASSAFIDKLETIQSFLENDKIQDAKDDLKYIVDLQKMISTISEIEQNGLIGEYEINNDNCLIFKVNSYSVIDYVDAILGDEYIQIGDTVHAEWFGVPQERRRYIALGIRKDLYNGVKIELPSEPENFPLITVGEAILDLQNYSVGYNTDYPAIPYNKDDNISTYALEMRKNSNSVKNHITTQTTKMALERFKKIEPGNNFHSLTPSMKSTYSQPERTQNTIYLRLNPDAPSGTVVNVRKSMWIHPKLDRAITVREAARLQSFPDDFEFIGTKDSQYQQVGNAVPPLLAKGIALQVLKYIK